MTAIPSWANIAFPIKKALICGCPPRHVEACSRAIELVSHDQWRQCYAELAEAVSHHSRNMVVLYGTPGSGKTQLAVCVLLRCAQVDGTNFSAVFTTARNMFDNIRSGFDNGGEMLARNRYRGARMLVVDELSNTKWSEWEQNEFIAMMNERYGKRGSFTILISNDSHKELQRKFGASVMSRMEEVGSFIEMSGWSFRGGAE